MLILRKAVGITKVKVLIKNPKTGSGCGVYTHGVFTWISKDTSGSVGIKPRRVRRFRTIDGRVVMKSAGLTTIGYEEHETMSR